MSKPVQKNAIAGQRTALPAGAMTMEQIRISAQRELELARRLRLEAQQYHRDITVRARSEAQQLILQARRSIEHEARETVRRTTEELQKVVADIRIVRITAQEELAALRKFTDAARLCSMSMMLGAEEEERTEVRKKKPVAASK